MIISPVERLYREISQPQPAIAPKPEPKLRAEEAVNLVRRDVIAILTGKRKATITELRHVLDHAEEFSLSAKQLEELRVMLTVAIADDLHRRDVGMVFDLGYLETPYGLLANRRSYELLLRDSAQAIRFCRLHRPPRCQCWRGARDILWSIRKQHGEKSPESYAALKLWEELEWLELATRPVPNPGIVDDLVSA